MARETQAMLRFGKYVIMQVPLNIVVGELYIKPSGKDKGMERVRDSSRTYHASYEQALNNIYNRMLVDDMNNPQINMVKKFEKSILDSKEEIMNKLQEYIDAK